MLIVGGFYYLTSFGDPEKLKSTRDTEICHYWIYLISLLISYFKYY